MKTIPSIMIACAAALAVLSPTACAEGGIYIPGSLEKEAQLKRAGLRYESVLLKQFYEYATARFNGDPVCSGHEIPRWTAMPVEEARQHIIVRIKVHPEEVNDAGYGCTGTATPLSLALECKDVELVKLLLEHGAIPYSPGYNGDAFSRYTSELVKIIEAARKEWPAVEICPHPFEKLRRGGKGAVPGSLGH